MGGPAIHVLEATSRNSQDDTIPTPRSNPPTSEEVREGLQFGGVVHGVELAEAIGVAEGDGHILLFFLM